MRTTAQLGYVLGLLFLAFLVLAGAMGIAIGFDDPPDPGVACSGARSDGCMTREQASVELDSEGAARVRYDDETRTKRLDMRDDWPAAGTRVLIERWNGDVVSLYDPVTERRYRTKDWVVKWSGYDFVLPLVMTILASGAFVALLVAFVRRYAAPRLNEAQLKR